MLYDVIPGCMNSRAIGFFRNQVVPTFDPKVMPTGNEVYLFHVEAGVRIYELYGWLDNGDGDNADSLARLLRAPPGGSPDYSGPWAMQTLGGAGGQTIVGAFSTGTHGGDHALAPIVDAVQALHLVGPDGQQHWIERRRIKGAPIPLVDRGKLQRRYGAIEVHRDDEMLNAVALACGRMGVIYSVVLRVGRQYALVEATNEEEWSEVSTWICDLPSQRRTGTFKNRFVGLVINLNGRPDNKNEHSCYVTTRELLPLLSAGDPPRGRSERGGGTDPGALIGTEHDFLTLICSSNDWITAALNAISSDANDLRIKAGITFAACTVVIAFPLTPPPARALAMSAQKIALAIILWAEEISAVAQSVINDVLPPLGDEFGGVLAGFANWCADNDRFEIYRRVLAFVFDKNQNPGKPPKPAISYAAMDIHDYTNVGCAAPGDSIEVFVDASTAGLVKFIDWMLTQIEQLESGALDNGSPRAFGGYAAVRFTAASEALLAMQKWPTTCSIEIAGLSKVRGTEPFFRAIDRLAVEEADAIAVHWGQRNNVDMRSVGRVWDANGPSGRLFRWREVLSRLSDNGQYSNFSTTFTKHRGLEVAQPKIQNFAVSLVEGCVGETSDVAWQARSNPPETKAVLSTKLAGESSATRVELPGLSGVQPLSLAPGRTDITLVLERQLNDELFTDSQTISAVGYRDHDQKKYSLKVVPRMIDGIERWGAEINLWSQSISNRLFVEEVSIPNLQIPGAWLVRTPGVADVRIDALTTSQPLPSHPIFNGNWLFFAEDPGVQGAAPALEVDFRLVCAN